MKHYILQKLFQRKSCPRLMALSVLVLVMLFSTNLNAQIAQRGTATTGTSSSATVTVNRPTGVVAGDIMIANIANYFDSNTQTTATSSGWTAIAGTNIERGRASLLWKIATSSEPTSYTFTVTSSSGRAVGGIVAFSGVNNTTPFDVTPSTSWTTASNASVTNIPSITTLTTNTAVLLFGAAARVSSNTNANFSNTNWTMTSPATLTELFDVGNNANNTACIGAAWATKPATGATGNGRVNCTVNTSPRLMAGIALVLRPACETVTSASSSPTLCANSALTNITHTTTGATGIGTATGLPGGVTPAWASNTITISGTPTVAGTYDYSIPLTGGFCGGITATGRIVVTAAPVVTAAANTTTFCGSGTVNLTGSTNITGTSNVGNQDFENTATYTATGGSTKTGTSGSGDRPASASFVGSPTTSYWVNNGTATVTTQNFTGLQNGAAKTVSMHLASFSIGSTTNGAESTDNVWVDISLDGGSTYSREIEVNGGASGSTHWGFSTGTGVASVTYDGNNTATIFAPTGGGARTTDGFSLLQIALPTSATQVRVRVRLFNNSGSEAWIIDDITVSQAIVPTYSWTSNPSGFTSALQNPSGVTVSASTTYTLTATNPATGCSGSDDVAITVTPNNTASAGSSTPTLCVNTALTNITHTTTGATGIGTATGLPAGVTALWASNTITISGTPTVAGTYDYSIPLTGGCGTVSATGTITVINVTMTAAAPSSSPTLRLNTALTNITHTTTGATGIGTATGLPAGVSATWASNTITISGTPTAEGIFNYSIPLTGGCNSVNATGTITVVTYKSEFISANLGSANWCAGETREISVTIKNIGSATWADGAIGTQNINVGVKWNTNGGNWADYHLRTDAGGLAPGETGTFTFTLTAANNTGSNYTTNLAAGTNNITFDLVYEGISWFAGNGSGVGPGNTVFRSSNQTINAVPTAPSSPVNGAVCLSGAVTISATAPAGNTIDWYSASTGGSVLTNGSGVTSFTTPDISTTTIYYAESRNTTTGCVSASRTEVTATINEAPSTTGVSICADGTGSLSATFASCPNLTGQTSGPRDATSGANVTGVGTLAWTNPGNIAGAGTAGMSVAANTTTNYLRGTGYGFEIPTDATIEGITVSIRRASGSTSTATNLLDNVVSLVKDGTITGENKARTNLWSFTTQTTQSYGSGSDLWTSAWTPADINNANFGVVLSIRNTNTGTTARTAAVDFMQITVTYTIPGSLQWYTASSGGTAIGSGSTFNPVGVANSGLANTNAAGTTSYYVACSTSPGTCRAKADFVINPKPTVTTSGNLSICVGSSATITASGAASYVWDNSLGTASSVSVSPSTTTTYTVTGTDANGCTNTAETTITVFPIQTVSVSIEASQTTICSGASVTFTATPTNGGTNPAYQWKVDGINVGTNSPTFTSSTLANGNVVSCVMTSNATVCITGSPATSNTVTMTVNPNLPASVSVGASATSICVGTSVTFTATPTNGGTTPSYQWKLNGSNVGTNSATYTSSALADGNTVSVVMTSNASPCLTGSPATSNSISMIVAPTTVGGTISGGDVNVCHGSTPSDLTLTGHVGAVVRWEKATTNAFADAITIASTSAVLSGSLIGSVTGPVFIRAVVQSGNCNSVFSSTTSLNVASTTWNGSAWTNGEPNSTTTAIITGNFTPTADLYACSLTVSNQAVVTIPSAVDVILSGALTVEPLSSFTLEHDSNLTQTISASNAVNSGTIIVKEATPKLKRQDYVMFSSPVSGQKLQSFSPATLSSRFYTYNPATNLYTLVPSPSTTNFATGSGYLIRTPNNFPTNPTVWTANYVGTPFNGTLTLPVTNGSYNAVGNPYPSTIDADMFFDANGITEALYFYRKTNGVNTSAYATYTKGGGVSSSGQSEGNGNSNDPNSLAPDGNIAVGQGFIVKATSNTVTFNNAMRLNSGAGVQLRASVERHRVWLNMTNPAGFFSQTLVAYMTGATNGVDAAIDGRYFNDNQTALTTIINGQEFAIQGRSLPFENLDVVSIGFKTEFATTYTISIEKVDGLFSAGQAVYLKDNLTNTYTNLRLGSYTFNSVAGVFNSRFELRFAALPTFYQDADGDSFGSAFNTIEAETAPQGYVSNGNDCNDNNALQNPNASEIAGNNIDDNCDGNVDEITSLSTLVATSCGVTLTNFADLLYAVRLTNVGPVQGYRFRVSNGGDVRIIESAVNSFSLVQLPGGATLGTTYAIEVSVKSNGFYRAYGPSCNVTTQATPTPTIVSNPTCGTTLANISASIYCNMVSNASGYRFRVRNGDTIVGVVDRTINRFSLIDIGISNIAFGTTYTVDVLLAFGGELRPESEYGQACTFTTPATPGTSRVIQPSCGSVISNLWQLIYVQQVVGAQGYRFEISTGGQLYYHNSVRSSFSMRNVVGLPLNANTTYEIRVAILHNGVYQEFANACTFTTAPVVLRILSDEPLDGEAQIGDANLLETQSTSTPVFAPVAYPNPFGESFKVSIPDATMDIVNVLVYDFSGKLLDKKVIFASEINDYQFGNQLPSGDYLLVIGQGANVKSMHINKR